MSIYLEKAQEWLNQPNLDKEIRSQLEKALSSEELLKNYFYSSLSFGTAGLRGIMQPGTN